MIGSGKNQRKKHENLEGSNGLLDQLMEKQNFEAEDIVNQFHRLLTEGRMNLDDMLLSKI